MGKFTGEFAKHLESAGTGVVIDDQYSYDMCKKEGISCLYSTLETSEENIKKAYEYAIKVRDIAAGKIPAEMGKGLNGVYKLLKYNCIDFLRETMNRADSNLTWENNLKYTREPTYYEKVSAHAWQYFYLRKAMPSWL